LLPGPGPRGAPRGPGWARNQPKEVPLRNPENGSRKGPEGVQKGSRRGPEGVQKGPRRAEEVVFGVLKEEKKRPQGSLGRGGMSASQPQWGPKKGHRRVEEGAFSVLEKEGRKEDGIKEL
jgi:hypothetical protein